MSGRGRPRSEASRQAVLAATADLLRDVGYDGMTIGAIAARAGVGRQTIYRWWDSKSAIVGEAVVEGVVQLADPVADSAATDVASWLTRFASTLTHEPEAALVRGLAAAAAEDPGESDALYAAFTLPAHETLAAMIAAESPAETREGAGILADAAIGAMLYRLLTRQRIDAEYVHTLSRLRLD